MAQAALLDIRRFDNAFVFSFIDRSRPSLSFDDVLKIPQKIIDDVQDEYFEILTTASARLTRRDNGGHGLCDPDDSLLARIDFLSDQIRHSLVPQSIIEMISLTRPNSILLKTNSPLLPWEIVRLNGDILSFKYPIGRCLPTNVFSRQIKNEFSARQLRVLIIANPTCDLLGADLEVDALDALMSPSPFFEHQILSRNEATLSNFSRLVQQVSYDVIHYAGHSDLAEQKYDSGIFAFADTICPAVYVAKLLERNPPRLFFLNSCNSGVVETTREIVNPTDGIAPSLLRSGVHSIIGALWPVVDEAAIQVAKTFYEDVAKGGTIGGALNFARSCPTDVDTRTYWLGYTLFGDPLLRLIEDKSWAALEIRSGGAAAAMPTFAGRFDVHISSLHSFAMAADRTDTVAIGFVCECINSEALVFRKNFTLDALQDEKVRIGVPTGTGCEIFLYKILDEIGIQEEKRLYIHLDTAEVLPALRNSMIDCTIIWQPILENIKEDGYFPIYSKGKNNFTLCVAVVRRPRSDADFRMVDDIRKTLAEMGKLIEGDKAKWSQLLAHNIGFENCQLYRAAECYLFENCMISGDEPAFLRLWNFVQSELEALRNMGKILSDNWSDWFWFDSKVEGLVLEEDTFLYKADVQFSISSLPLLIGRFLNRFI